MKWVYEPEPDEAAQGVACCDVVNRGASFAAGMIIDNTLEDRRLPPNARHAAGAGAPTGAARGREALS